MGIKQRQAYNYIQVVESLPARLIEENAAAGVTKLALLAKLNPEEREDLTGEALANITVAELKKLVEERDAMAQQLSIFQTEPEAVAEVEAEPIDPDEIRRQAEEETRQQMAAAFAEERTQLEAKHKAAMSEAVLKAEQAAAAEVRKVKADAKKQAEAETRQQVAQAREEAAKAAAAQQEAKYRAKLDQAKQAEEEAQRRAETMAKQMEASSDENAVRFFMLFEQLQQKVEDMKARKGPGLIKKGGAAKSSATGGAAQQPQPKTRQTTSLPTCWNTRTKSEGTRALCSRKSIFSRLRISGRLNSSIGVRRRARRNDKPREGSNQAGQHRHSAGR